MTYRKLVLTNEETYHVFNRGVARAPIFNHAKDYQRFLDLLNYYRFAPKLSFSHYNRLENSAKQQYMQNLKKNNPPIAEILAYCLMPNHFHLLLKQTKDHGIKLFISNLQNGYAKYFNTSSERSGALFQAMFKAVRIETDEQLLHVSRYIHLNPSTAYIVEPENLLSYKWSSLPEYLGKVDAFFTNTQLVLELAGGKDTYNEFVLDQTDYQRELDKIKHLFIE